MDKLHAYPVLLTTYLSFSWPVFAPCASTLIITSLVITLTYCLDNDQTHFKNNFTVHFIENNSANRRWPEVQIVAAICLFTVIRPTPLVSVSWIIWRCYLADQFVLYYFLAYSYGELNCDGLHILITFIYIINPLLASTHKPVLPRALSSTTNDANWLDYRVNHVGLVKWQNEQLIMAPLLHLQCDRRIVS